MMTNLINMGGYGIFVWSAFIFTFVCCLSLYIKTKKELKNQEKIFLSKFKELPAKKVVIARKRKAAKQILADDLSTS